MSETTQDAQAGNAASTRERLLEAAAQLFAERGRDGVSIREIAAAAGVRHGGINYHFRTKDELYHEVLRRFGPVGIQSVTRREIPSDLSPEEAEQVFAQIVGDLVGIEVQTLDPVSTGLLISELSQPGGPNEALYQEVVVPLHAGMSALIGMMFPALTDEREREVAAFNVMAQCIFIRIARPVALRLFDVDEYDPELTALLASRIIETSLRGLGSPARAHPRS